MDLEVLLSIPVEPESSGTEWDRCCHHSGMRGCKLIDVMSLSCLMINCVAAVPACPNLLVSTSTSELVGLVAFLAWTSHWQLKHLH